LFFLRTEDGILEDEASMPEPPKIYSVKSFQDMIIEQIKNRMDSKDVSVNCSKVSNSIVLFIVNLVWRYGIYLV
jgi:hypothetical protein